jgi:hypothetical protein
LVSRRRDHAGSRAGAHDHCREVGRHQAWKRVRMVDCQGLEISASMSTFVEVTGATIC